MSNRFQIEDIVAQSSAGVVFHATDSASGRPVAVRRFLPAGADRGGLDAGARAAFEAALARLAGFEHPGLRAVIAGGCDPVDGVPFVVTEWVEGTALDEWLQHGPLRPEQALAVLAMALDLSALLSQRLGEEAVWVGTSPRSIVVGDEAGGRGLTFWISTAHWLEGERGRGNLHAIVHLAEDLLGWRGCAPVAKAAGGLGGWFNWLRANARTADLATARAKLEALRNPVAPPAARAAQEGVARARPAPAMALTAPRTAAGFGPLIVSGIAALAVACIAWWLLGHRPRPAPQVRRPAAPVVAVKNTASGGPAATPAVAAPASPPAAAAPPVALVEPDVAAANARAAELQRQILRRQEQKPAPPPARPAVPGTPGPDPGRQPLRVEEQLPVFAPEQVEAMMGLRHRPVVVEGKLAAIDASRDGRRLHLMFSLPNERPVTFGILYVDPAEQGPVRGSLEAWLGKRVRMSGKVDIDHTNRIDRPKIIMNDRAAVRLAQ